jgi:hypothetical protein
MNIDRASNSTARSAVVLSNFHHLYHIICSMRCVEIRPHYRFPGPISVSDGFVIARESTPHSLWVKEDEKEASERSA